MDRKFTNGAKRIFAALLAVTLLAGTVPYTPAGDMFGNTVLTANAANYKSDGTPKKFSICNVGDTFEYGTWFENDTGSTLYLKYDDNSQTPETIGTNDSNNDYHFYVKSKLIKKEGNTWTFQDIRSSQSLTTNPVVNGWILYDGTPKNVIESGATASSGKTVYYGITDSPSVQPSSWYSDINNANLKRTDKGEYFLWMKADGDYNNYKPFLTYWTFTITDDKEQVQSYYWGGNSNGSQAHPYIISDVKGWNFLCDSLENGDNFSGKYFRLDNNITVSKMAGSSGHDFTGTFDGNSNTLTFNYGTSNTYANDEYTAPFRFVESGCTIKNLHTAGDIYTSAKYASGLIGAQYGAVSIKNCRVSTVIHSTVNGDGTHAGFVATNANSNGSEITIEGCVFDGKMVTNSTNSTGNCAGFVGWKNKTITITNSVYAPSAISSGEIEVVAGTGSYPSATFVRNGSAGSNCYYTRTLGTEQGKKLLNITAGQYVTINKGTSKNYNVSGITAYTNGIDYNGKFYAGNGDTLSLSHSERDRYTFQNYSVNSGSVSGNTFTVGSADTTVNAVYDYDYATVKWVDWDGTKLYEEEIKKGNTPSYPYSTPTREEDEIYEYRFKQWSPTPSAVQSDTTYTAQYESWYIWYWEYWYNGYTQLCTSICTYDQEVQYPGNTLPTKQSDEKYSYEFTGWSEKKLSYNPTIQKDCFQYYAQYRAIPNPDHFSQNGNTYTIHDSIGWEIFCECLQDNNTYNHFSGKTVKLADNFDNSSSPITKTAGSDGHEFMGIFDGNSKTLNANISGSTGGEAVFYRINGATIKNLTLSGSITGGQHCGALVGFADGTNIIENVNVTANVSLDGSISANKAHHGGVIGHALSSNTTLRGVVYSGTISSTTASTYVYVGGLVGWADSATITIENSIFDGTYNGGTLFHPILCKTGNKTVTGTFTNVYYTATPTANNLNYYLANAGKNAYTITAGDNVTLSLSGTATTYNVSGITAYKNNSGLKYGNTFYAGNGDNVTLTLSHDTPTGYTFTGYTASAGTIDGTALTMPESDVVINAVDAVNTYTVTWVDGDGNSTTDTVAYGTVPTAPQNPTKTGNAQYSYTFSGWDKEISAVTGNVTYTAQFTESVNKYTVRWVNYDGQKLKKDENVAYGTMPTYNGATPTKEATAQYTYTFSGWDKEISAVTENVTYTAQFAETTNTYTVTWKVNGKAVEVDEDVPYGTIPEYNGETPAREPDNSYTYTFTGWDIENTPITGNTVYFAQFSCQDRYFNITVEQSEGGTISADHSTADYGRGVYVYVTLNDGYAVKSVSCNGNALEADNGGYYHFFMPAEDVVITAEFKKLTYTVTWKDADGTVLETDENVEYGTTPTYDGETPAKTATEFYTYTFSGWDKEITAVTGDVTYTAQFTETPKYMGGLTVCDDTRICNYIPYKSDMNHHTTGTEQIYPSSMLTNLAGKKLYSMTFYSSDDVEIDVRGMQVYLAEVDFTTMPNGWIAIPDNAVKVFDSDYDFGSGENVITFDTPYTYNGGNLMVIIQNTSAGTNHSTKCFYGVWGDTTGVSSYRYTTNNYTYASDFLAKCTFGYAYTEKYTVTWKNADGTVLETDTNVLPFAMPAYDGTTPTKTATEFYTYTFSGWDKEITAVTGNVTYTAQFTETPKYMGGLTVCDSTNTYYNIPYKSDANSTATGSEQIYPSSMLAGMTGKNLYSMTFYSSDDVEIDVKGMQVYLAEVDFTTMPNGWTAIPDNAVKVFDSDYDFGSGANVITFDTQYTYNGGNLMVIIQNTSNGTNHSDKKFYGVFGNENGVSNCRYTTNDYTYPSAFLAKCTFSYAYTEKYTVTWKNADGTVLETDTNVMPLTMPEYNGEKTVTYWTDGTNTYSYNGLPAVTTDVTYTARILEVKTLAVGTVFYAGDLVDFGGYYINHNDESGRVDARSYDLCTIIYIAYDTDYSQYKICDSTNSAIIWLTSGYYGTDIGIKVVGGDGTYDNPFIFKVYKDTKHTVTWIGTDGTTVLETDTDVPFGTVPTFDDTITVPDGKALYWTDGTKTYSSNGLPVVTGDVSYTAVFLDAKSLAVGTVFYKGDMVDFGYKWFNYDDTDGGVNLDNSLGLITIDEPEYRSRWGQYWISETDERDYGLWVTSDDYGTDIGIKVVGGDGTEENPFIFEVVPNTKHTVTWIGTDGTTVLETDTDVSYGTTPTFDGTITVPDGKTLYWTDGTNTYSYNGLPAVTTDVTYTARILEVKTLAVGTVFGTGDLVDFGYQWFNNYDGYGIIQLRNYIGLIEIGEPEYYDGYYWISESSPRNYGFYLVPPSYLGTDFNIKVVGGDGTEDKPFIFKILDETESLFKVMFVSDGKIINDMCVERGKFVSPNVMQKDGYTFAGWLDENGNLFDIGTPITADITLTAKWVSLSQSHTILFVPEGQTTPFTGITVAGGEACDYDYNTSSYTKKDDNWVFMGWYTADGVKFDFTQPVTEDVTVYETWIPISEYDGIVVTLKDDYDNVVTILPMNEGDKLPAQYSNDAYMVINGFIFGGWIDENGNPFDVDTPIMESMTLTEHWTKDPDFTGHYVTFKDGDKIYGIIGANDGNTVPYTPNINGKDGYEFLGWYYGDTYIYDITVTEDIVVQARWLKNEVNIQFIDVNGKTKSTLTITPIENSFANVTVTEIPSAPYLDGYEFTGWTVGETLYTNADDLKAYLTELVSTVPDDDIIVNEVYEQKQTEFTVTVNGGTIKDGDTTGTFKPSDQVYVTATGGSESQVFSHWEKDGIIVGYEETYAFRMPSFDTELTAVYKDKPEEKVGTAYIESVTKTGENKVSFVSVVSVPDDKRILRAGVVANTEAELKGEELTIENTKFQSYNSTTCRSYTSFKYTFTKGKIQENEIWCVRAYVQYTDKDGNIYETYGDMVKADRNGIISEV